jgi:hypothetical protein
MATVDGRHPEAFQSPMYVEQRREKGGRIAVLFRRLLQPGGTSFSLVRDGRAGYGVCLKKLENKKIKNKNKWLIWGGDGVTTIASQDALRKVFGSQLL